MTDFDPFSAAEEKQETDPVADFLSREEKQLAELNDFGFEGDIQSMTKSIDKEPEQGGNVSDQFNLGLSANLGTSELGDASNNGDNSHFDRYNALNEDGPVRVVSDKIRKWQEEQEQRLISKDAESEKKQKEWLQVAVQELEEYQRHREEILSKSKKSNRKAEEVFIHERDEKKPGGEWERVCRLCDFNPKTATRTSKDVSRLRSLLLQLKQTPNLTFVA